MDTWNFLDQGQDDRWFTVTLLVLQLLARSLIVIALFLLLTALIGFGFLIMAALAQVNSPAFMIICAGMALPLVISMVWRKVRT